MNILLNNSFEISFLKFSLYNPDVTSNRIKSGDMTISFSVKSEICWAKLSLLVNKLGVGCPNDWVERNVYSQYPGLGIILLLLIDTLAFGWWGFLVWGIQMIWIPFWAAGVVNGLCHWVGYRNYDVKDTSRNLVPIDFWVGGELLHNNHHGDGTSAKFSRQWWEFDIGWFYIKVLEKFNLAKLRA